MEQKMETIFDSIPTGNARILKFSAFLYAKFNGNEFTSANVTESANKTHLIYKDARNFNSRSVIFVPTIEYDHPELGAKKSYDEELSSLVHFGILINIVIPNKLYFTTRKYKFTERALADMKKLE